MFSWIRYSLYRLRRIFRKPVTQAEIVEMMQQAREDSLREMRKCLEDEPMPFPDDGRPVPWKRMTTHWAVDLKEVAGK